MRSTAPTLQEAHDRMLHHWDNQRYPGLVYVETTNACNARCTFCLYDRMEVPVQTMSLTTFATVAEKVKQGGLKVGAMFCFGEPLADPTLFDKIALGRSVDLFTGHLGLNTNVSLLKPEIFDKVLAHTGNITLSFTNVGAEFERLTGLSWDQCYGNALAFIKYRDKVKPGYMVLVGCNDVDGHNRAVVQAAFRGQKVKWARDAAIHWGSKVIVGPIDRSIMYHQWTCDGYKGALQVKPNGDCLFCAYDVIRAETRFANILTDDWPTIERRFKELWRQPSSLCLRCDFWWNYQQMRAGGWKRGPHVDGSWQKAYGSLQNHWEGHHQLGEVRYLTDSPLADPTRFLQLQPLLRRGRQVLNVGVGTGRCTRDLHARGCQVSALDIAPAAVAHVADCTVGQYTDPTTLPADTYDLALCYLVVRHTADVDLFPLLRHVLRSLKPGGVLAIQYASPPDDRPYSETLEQQQQGTVQRGVQHWERIVETVGGQVVLRVSTRTFVGVPGVTDDNHWNGCHIRRAP